MKQNILAIAALALLFVGAACTPNSLNGQGDGNGVCVTVGADHISAISAVLKGKANLPNSTSSDLEVGFHYSTSVVDLRLYPIMAIFCDDDNNFTTTISGLEPGTTYYFRGYVWLNGKVEYGQTKKFKTKDIELETGDATDLLDGYSINGAQATLNASFALDLSLSDVEEYGFCFGTSEDSQDTFIKCKDITDKSFKQTLTNLFHNTQYWYKAYARLKNKGKQTIYGSLKTFTTAPYSDYVDLGLSVKWGKYNLGADHRNECSYYAWGETEPYHDWYYGFSYRYEDGYFWSSYKWYKKKTLSSNSSTTGITKYGTKENHWAGEDSPDNKTVLDLEDDAAHVALGGNWRIPTREEWEELITQCTWTISPIFEDTRVTGPNGKVIYLHRAGYMEHDFFIYDKGCPYWSSSLSDTNDLYAKVLLISDDNVVADHGYLRYLGIPIRPVLE